MKRSLRGSGKKTGAPRNSYSHLRLSLLRCTPFPFVNQNVSVKAQGMCCLLRHRSGVWVEMLGSLPSQPPSGKAHRAIWTHFLHGRAAGCCWPGQLGERGGGLCAPMDEELLLSAENTGSGRQAFTWNEKVL